MHTKKPIYRRNNPTKSSYSGIVEGGRGSRPLARMKCIAVGLMISALGLQGCSVFSVGESEYSCSGIPDKASCMSAREAYMATNNGNVPRSMNADGSVTSKAQSADRGDRDIEMIRQVVVDEYVAPPIPNKTVPIRAEAKVMRIWIAPWQDGSGDLHISSYVYTEVEPRKWLFDNQGSARAIHLEPLQTLPAPEQPDGRRN